MIIKRMDSKQEEMGEMFGPQDPLIPGMNVVAKYRKLDVLSRS
jgi:hypothetical protein